MAASVGPVYFIGMTLASTQLWTVDCASSCSVMVTLFFLPAGPVVRVSLIQSNSDFESTMPRFSVTSLTLWTPGTLRTWFSFSLPLRYSATVISVPMPETSEKPPNVWPPSKLTMKLKAP